MFQYIVIATIGYADTLSYALPIFNEICIKWRAGTSNVGQYIYTYARGIACMHTYLHTSIMNLAYTCAHEMTWMEEDIRPFKYCNKMFSFLLLFEKKKSAEKWKEEIQMIVFLHMQIYRFVHLTLLCCAAHIDFIFMVLIFVRNFRFDIILL